MSVLALDIGGTELKSAIVEKDLIFTACDTVKTPKYSLDELLAVIETLWAKYGNKCEGISISLPGIIDTEKGFCFNSGGSLKYLDGQMLSQIIYDRLGAYVHLENDGKAAAIAELESGSLKGCSNAAVFIIGTGVGGGIIVNGKVISGIKGSAGEFSHICANINEADNDGDAYGFLWNYCSVPTLLSMFEKESGFPVSDGREFFRQYEQGSPSAVKALDLFCKNVSVQILNISILLNCEKVAVGGGISRQPALLCKIREKLDTIGMAKELNTIGLYEYMKPEIVPCAFGPEANLIGAAIAFGENNDRRQIHV